MFQRRKKRPVQDQLFVMGSELPRATADAFYRKLNETLERIGFAEAVWKICEPAYADESKGGKPGIDPVVYLKMLMVGFLEDLPGQRAIASRCADSLSIRGFLGYSLTENTPDHSSLSVIRDRLSKEQFEALHAILLKALHAHGLLKGKHLGIDSSIIEANASLRGLQHRNTDIKYWDYVKGLAAQSGIDPEDTKAVRRFDKKREGRKTSNEQWVNPHDPEAKVGRTKDGATDMVYKPEHITDLESGAIVAVEVRPGDAGDSESMSERVMEAAQSMAQAVPELGKQVAQSVTADEGYFAVAEVAALQAAGCRVIIGDPHHKRRRCAAGSEERKVLNKARRAVRSRSGKTLLRKRGEHLERSFCHILDHGGLRRATLRGCEKLTKRHYVAAMACNLSLLMRKVCGFGTPKQWLAGAEKAAKAAFRLLWAVWRRIFNWWLLANHRSVGQSATACLTISFSGGASGGPFGLN